MCKTRLAATLATLALACGTSKSGPATAGNFTLAAGPSTLSVFPGEEGYVLVTLTPSVDFNTPISLSVTGLPAGTSVEPVTVPPGDTSAVLVVHGGSTASTSAITVTATAGSITHTAGFQLSVTSAPAGGTNPVVTGIVRLDVAGGVSTGYSNPTGIAVNATTGVVYMVNDQNGGLGVYDPAASSFGVVPIPSAQRVAVDSGSGTVYAVGGTQNLYVIKGSSVSQVAVGGALQGVAVDSQNGQIFVGENLNHTVYQVDGASLHVQPTAWRFSSAADGPVEGPVAVDERRHTVYASLYGGVGIINQANGDSWTLSISRVNSTLTEAPVDLSVDARSGQAYILGSDGFSGQDGWVHLLDDSYLPNSTSSTATNAPSSLALDPGTNKLYVADSRNESVNVLDLNTHTFLKQVMITPSGGQDQGPIGVAVDPQTHQVYATMRYYDGLPALVVIDGR